MAQNPLAQNPLAQNSLAQNPLAQKNRLSKKLSPSSSKAHRTKQSFYARVSCCSEESRIRATLSMRPERLPVPREGFCIHSPRLPMPREGFCIHSRTSHGKRKEENRYMSDGNGLLIGIRFQHPEFVQRMRLTSRFVI